MVSRRELSSGPVVWLCIIVATCLLLAFFKTMLWLVIPVLLAIISYYILSPWVNIAMAYGLTRSRAVLIVTLILCVVLILVGLMVGPRLSMAAHNWRNALPEYLVDGENLVMKAQKSLGNAFPFMHVTSSHGAGGSIGIVSDGSVGVSDDDALKNNVATVATQYSGGIALELLHWIPSLLLVPYMTYFFLLDGQRFKRFLVQAIPNAFFEKTLYLFYRVDEQLRRYFQGLLLLTALDGVCLGVGLWFLGLNAPFFLAGLAAILAWIPYLGSIVGCVMVMLVAAHDAPNSVWLPYETVTLFIFVRLLDDFIFLPMTVGRILHMHPLVTVLMILLGGAVAGVSGLLLVMPVLGVVMVAGQVIGELMTDERILARFWHSRELRRARARTDL